VTAPVPAVLVKGREADAPLVAQEVRSVVGALLEGRDAATCVEELAYAGVDELDVARLVDAMTTPPFLVDRRIVVVRDAGRLSAQDATRIAAVLEHPTEGVCVVFAAGSGTVPAALQRAIASVGEVRDASVGASLRDRRAFVQARARASGVRLEPEATERLTAHVGEDLSRVDQILATLEVAYGAGAALGTADLEPFLGEGGAVPEWDLTDAIAAGDAAAALDVLRRLLGPGGRAGPGLVFTLQRHYLRLLRLDGAGARTKEAAGELLSVSAYPAGKLLAQSHALGSERVRHAVGLVAAADEDVKGASALEGDVVLEILVARLARLHRAAGRAA